MSAAIGFWIGGAVVEYVHQHNEGSADLLMVLGWPLLFALYLVARLVEGRTQ